MQSFIFFVMFSAWSKILPLLQFYFVSKSTITRFSTFRHWITLTFFLNRRFGQLNNAIGQLYLTWTKIHCTNFKASLSISVKGDSKVGKQSGHFKWLKTSTVSTTTFNQTNLIEYFPWFSLFAVSLVWEWKRHVSVAHSIFDILMVATVKQHIIYLKFRSFDSEIRTMLACVVYVGCQNALDSTYLGGRLELFWLEVRPAYLSCVKKCCISNFVSPFIYN